MGICLSTAGIQLYTLQMLGALCVPTSWEQCCWWSQFSRPSSISGGQTLGLTSSLPKNFLEAEMCAANLIWMVALVFAAGWLWESDQCSYFPLWDLVSNVLFRMAKRVRLLYILTLLNHINIQADSIRFIPTVYFVAESWGPIHLIQPVGMTTTTLCTHIDRLNLWFESVECQSYSLPNSGFLHWSPYKCSTRGDITAI